MEQRLPWHTSSTNIPEEPEKKLDENIASLFYEFRMVLDAYSAKALALSRMNELVESFPGLLILRVENTIDNLAVILGLFVVENNRPFFWSFEFCDHFWGWYC